MRDLQPDDLDRLFARLDLVEPPADFTARLMARIDAGADVVNRQPIWRRGLVYACAYVAALIALVILAYSAGVSMAHNGTSTLVSTLTAHAEVFTYAPHAYIEAILATIPWAQIAGLALDLLLLGIVTRLLLRGARSLRMPAA
jgi:hypothetical protein